MRIAMLAPLTSPWSRQAALRLAEQGHEVHYIDVLRADKIKGYLQGRDDLHIKAVETLKERMSGIHLLGTRLPLKLQYLGCALKLRAIFRACEAQVLLTLWGGGWALMCYLSGVRPYAVFVGGGDILRVSGIQKQISILSLNRAAIVFANGMYFGQKAREFAPGARILPLYYGVDPHKFSPGSPSPAPIQIVCTRGFLKPYNNRYLIEALPLLPKNLPDFRITFTSPGDLIEEAKDLAKRTLTPDTAARISFLNGVTDDQMVGILQDSHIYVSLSRYDGTSISLLEALSCGLFPILSGIPQNREWIDPSRQNGFLVPLDRPRELARAIAQTLENARMRENAREYNRQLILSRADGRKNMARLSEELGKIVLRQNQNDLTA